MIRRTGIIIALAAVAMLALAGCSGGVDNASTAKPAAPSTAALAPVEPEAPKITAIEDALQRGVEITSPTESDENAAPEFTGLTKWLNSPPLTMTELKGEVVLVDFWTYT